MKLTRQRIVKTLSILVIFFCAFSIAAHFISNLSIGKLLGITSDPGMALSTALALTLLALSIVLLIEGHSK